MSEPKRRRRQVIEPLPKESFEEQFSQGNQNESQDEPFRPEFHKAERASSNQDSQPKKSTQEKKPKRGFIGMITVATLLMIVCFGGAVLYNSASFTYQRAQNALSKGKYAEAIRLLAGLGGYEDSTNLTVYCKALQLAEEGEYDSAISALNGLGDYKDCLLRIPYYAGRGYEQNGLNPTNEWENFEYLEAAVSAYKTNPLYLDSSTRIESLDNQIQQIKSGLYSSAVDYAESGEYAQADSIFMRLGAYSDCKKRISYYNIREAEDALPEQDQDAVIAIRDRYLETLDYLDCSERAKQLQERADAIVSNRYAQIDDLLRHNQIQLAQNILDSFGGYGNARIKEYYYLVAEAYLSAQDYDAASLAFAKASDYKNAEERVGEPYYVQAEKLLEAGKYDDASAAFAKAGEYNDAKNRIGEPYYVQAETLLAKGEFENAAWLFSKAGSFSDAAERMNESYYELAKALYASQKYEEAIVLFEELGNYSNAVECEKMSYYAQAEAFVEIEDYPAAIASFAHAVGYKDALKRSYQLRYQHMHEGSVAAGCWYTLGVKTDGTLVAVGEHNEFGQLNVGKWINIVAVCAGSFHTVGLKTDGTVLATGNNELGQCDVNEWNNIVAVCAGSSHTVGLRMDGTVVAAGSNEYGQCDVNEWNDIVFIAAGSFHTVGVRRDGTVVAVGYNRYGQCNLSEWKTISAVAAGHGFTIGLTVDGTVIAEGNNKDGQCSVGDWHDIVAIAANDNHSVGLMADGKVIAVGSNIYGECDVGGWWTMCDIVSVAAGYRHTVGLTRNGTVVAKGIDLLRNWRRQCDVNSWNEIGCGQVLK